ncbi:Leucine rich repeat domain-containing protein [Pleurostoma richardsiae]|uniref:Leucine rich repeat domain-containing protein n=1 Tax=Pleurostoma richardsiae TaxID=41990 RepID=A0AA38VUZ6_9PEZI|nr:Leucine rich repeat domain-containing protein [Pleurostoma richardsiae]
MDSEDGELFIRQLASFVRTHEKALANALQFRRQNIPRHGSSQSVSSVSTTGLTSPTIPERPSTSSSSTSGGLAAALSLGTLNFTSHSVKSAKLALTPHHLFYLLSRFEELAIPVGPMKIRLENLHDSTTSANYVSFLSQSQRSKSRGSDVGSIRSVSSIRSVMSGMSALWASFGIGSSISAARTERQKAAVQADLKYLYSAFTKIPCLKLAPDWRARLIKGYEEFPFDSAVPLYVFKNVQALEVSDIDFRQFFGWDRLADQLRSLTLKRASLEDPADILIDIVLDDMDKRRRRTSKSQGSPTAPWAGSSSPRRSPTMPHAELHRAASAPGSPDARSSAELQVGSLNSDIAGEHHDVAARNGRRPSVVRTDSDEPPKSPKSPTKSSRPRSHSPHRPSSSRNGSAYIRHSYKVRRSGSGSSHSSLSDSWHQSRGSASNLLAMGILPASKWRFLKHLSLSDNSLTSIPANSLAPLANTLHSLDLSSNLFTQIPDSLATLTALRALNLSHCMIDSLHSLTRNPLPAITAMNLRANRLQSIAGVEKLYPLERLDLRDNRLTDPMELARLTGIPEIREIWVEGNPFTRTHRDYRITIFNLFRQTPGYTEDIVIDAMGPTYLEKKYLVERTAEPPAVPVVKPPVPEFPTVDVSKPTIIYDSPKEPAVLRKERPVPKAMASEINTSSTRRRRAPKRRIVDLATSESASYHLQSHAQEPATPVQVLDNNYRISSPPEIHQASPPTLAASPMPLSQSTPDVPRIDTSVLGQLPHIYESHETQTQWKDSPDWDVGGELYRRKIEALRDKVGNGYLSVLSEEGWDPSQPPRYSEGDFGHHTSPVHGHPNMARAVSAQAITSGRTLG